MSHYDRPPASYQELRYLRAQWERHLKKLTTEANISNFYQHIISASMDRFDLEPYDVHLAISRILHGYRNTSNGRLADDLNFNDRAHAVGYTHVFAACHASMVRSAVFGLFQAPRVTDLLQRPHLSLACLGSGPCNDLIGFLDALYNVPSRVSSLEVLLMDKKPGWQHVVKVLLDVLDCEESTCDAERSFKLLETSVDFVACDLGGGWMDLRLVKADVVFMVKVLSVVPDDVKRKVLKNVSDNMAKGALLIYIDSLYPHSAFSPFLHLFDLIYEPCISQFSFSARTERFNHRNIVKCSGIVKVFRKK